MIRLLWLLSMALSAVLLGTSSAIYATQTLRPTGMLTIGPWEAVRSVGAISADPYAHAYVASSGQLPPGTAEGMRFVALGASNQQPLVPACTIMVSGTVDLSRLWTLTLTQPDGTALRTGPNTPPLAVHSQDFLYAADGTFELSIGPQPKSMNALLLPNQTPIGLVLHVYDGALTSNAETNEASLPSLTVGTSGDGCPL